MSSEYTPISPSRGTFEEEGLVEIDLREIFSVFFQNLKWILPASIVGLVAAYLFSAYLIPPKYTSSVSMYVNNNNESMASAALNINDINAAQKLVNTYIVILRDNEVLDQVAEQLHEEYSTEQLEYYVSPGGLGKDGMLTAGALRDVLTLRAVDNTEVLSIEAVTRSPVLSARICTILMEVAPDVLMRVVKAGSVEKIGTATVPDEPSSPRLLLNAAIGGLIAFLLATGIVFLRYFTDNTIKDEEDLRRHYNLPILGEIPDFSYKLEGEYKHYGN